MHDAFALGGGGPYHFFERSSRSAAASSICSARSFLSFASFGSVRNLVRGAGFPSGPDESFAEHDGELGFCLGPFARRHFPFLNDLAQDEKDKLRRRLVAGEMAPGPHG